MLMFKCLRIRGRPQLAIIHNIKYKRPATNPLLFVPARRPATPTSEGNTAKTNPQLHKPSCITEGINQTTRHNWPTRTRRCASAPAHNRNYRTDAARRARAPKQTGAQALRRARAPKPKRRASAPVRTHTEPKRRASAPARMHAHHELYRTKLHSMDDVHPLPNSDVRGTTTQPPQQPVMPNTLTDSLPGQHQLLLTWYSCGGPPLSSVQKHMVGSAPPRSCT
jgi:hypothetical protein